MTAQLFVALPNGETRCLDTPSSGIAEPLRQDLEVCECFVSCAHFFCA